MQTAPDVQPSVLQRFGRLFLSRQLAGSGPHVDPADTAPPPRAWWEHEHRMAWDSNEMRVFRACLSHGGKGVRDSVLEDLAAYHGLSAEACRDLCVNWEQTSLEEWRSADRSTAEGVIDFYDDARSWVFDLMWYAYLQSEGFGLASSVIAARFAVNRLGRGDHLDFGSGVGVTSCLFQRLGFRTTSADISKPMLRFTDWRARRHGAEFRTINLRTEALPTEAYDVITAIDTLVHVPDFDAAASDLHRALRPGGYLVTNFDVRAKDVEATAWHLYDNAVDLDLRLKRAGFAPERSLSPVTLCYRRVEPGTLAHRIRTATGAGVAPARKFIGVLHRVRWPTSQRIKKLSRMMRHEPRPST